MNALPKAVGGALWNYGDRKLLFGCGPLLASPTAANSGESNQDNDE
jgi:hypothetical protein